MQELREELATILNSSLQSGSVPNDRITIALKGEQILSWPISLTCILYKLMEHILASNLVKYLDTNGLMYDLQHVFRESRSCETQLASLVEDLVRKPSKGKQTDLILLFLFSKAFDKVTYSKLAILCTGYRHFKQLPAESLLRVRTRTRSR